MPLTGTCNLAHRPLIPVALLYVLGILLAAISPSLFPILPLFALAYALILLFALWPEARRISLAALIVLTGWINLTQRAAVLPPHDLRNLIIGDETIASVRGTLVNTPSHHSHESHGKEYSSFLTQLEIHEIQLNQQNWQSATGRVIVSTRGELPENIFAHQTVEIDGVLKPPPAAVAEGLFDYRNYLVQQGIYYELNVSRTNDWRLLSPANSPPLADRFSAWARKTLALGMPTEDESLRLEWALTLGWKEALTEEVSEPFIRAATYHIFAVDGLRIAIVSGILIMLLRAIGIPRIFCALLVVPFILFYAAMTGWPASAIRAIVMLFVVFGSWILKRPGDLINSLFAAAIIILAWEPRQLFQAGFQLSFFVVLCIILILPLFNKVSEHILKPDPLLPESLQPRWRKILRTPAIWVADLFLTSLVAWLGSIPLVAWYFHIFTPCSGPANVFAVPLCAFVLICNLTSLLLGAWFPYVAELYNHAGWFFMECIRVTSQWSANWPAAYYYVPLPGVFTIALYYLALITIFTGWLFKNPYRNWKISSLIFLTLIWCGLWFHHRPETQLTILPLGEGFGAYLQSNHSPDDWLIDCGNETSVDIVTKPFLRAQGVNHLSHLVLTHGDINYTGGAQPIIDLFQPRDILLNPISSRSPSYRDIESYANAHFPSRPQLKPGDQFGPWTILHPDPATRATRAEDNTLVLLANLDGIRVLLLSDLSRPGQTALLSRTNNLHADILVARAPDEPDPLPDLLLNAIQPRVIILHDTARHHTSEELTARLARRHIPILHTRETRSITLTTRPNHWQLTTMDGTEISNELLK